MNHGWGAFFEAGKAPDVPRQGGFRLRHDSLVAWRSSLTALAESRINLRAAAWSINAAFSFAVTSAGTGNSRPKSRFLLLNFHNF
jgi:hypothetical protein